MISITTAQLYAWISAFVWPLARILSVIAAAPIIGSPNLPARVKIGLAVLITLIVSPTLGPMPQVSPASGAGLLVLAQQIVIGLAMGLAMRLVFVAIEMAGEIAGLQMGLGFSTLYDPATQASTPVIGQFLGLVATLLFFALNGHLLVVSALVESFRAFPVAATLPAAAGFKNIAEWGSVIFVAGLVMSLPIMAALLIANIALGVLMRAAPQLNMFAVGFPITLSLGMIALVMTIPYVAPGLERLMTDGLRMMVDVAAATRGR